MPPVRTMPTFKPVKTERTHEENQERAYIAASRRSDRSLEARVESARRASEIHKKRTGRSLRVREEDVMNEEMYEEEDDDLPMQYRRINALNPHLSYAFAERLNNYINGQIGVRTALQQAIQQSNQYQQNQQMLNAQMQGNSPFPGVSSPLSMSAQSPWPMNNMQSMRPDIHQRSASIATPQDMASYQQAASQANSSPLMMHHRSMSMSVPQGSSPTHSANSHGMSHRKSSQSPTSAPSSAHPATAQGTKTSPQGQPATMRGNNFDAEIAPLTLQLPNETLQMLNGSAHINPAFFPAQNQPGQISPNMGKYSYNPNGKSRSSPTNGYFASQKPSGFDGLNQTLTQGTMDPQNASFFPPVNAPTTFGHFDANSYDAFADLNEGNDFGFGGFGDPRSMQQSGFVTPSETADATLGEFFDFQATPE